MARTSKTRPRTSGRQRRPAPSKARQRNYWLIGGGLLLVALIGLAVYANIQRSRPVAGEEKFPSQGNAHVPADAPHSFAYASTPPTSGPHYGSLVQWGIYDEPVAYQSLLHNMEDGGVIIFYQCPDGCPDTMDALSDIVRPYLAADRRVVLAPNDPTWTNGLVAHQDMGAPIAVAAWRSLLKLESVDADRVRTLIERYEGIDHHAG